MTSRVEGVLETALYVADLQKSRDFYKALFQFSVLVDEDRLCALSVADRQVLLLFWAAETTRNDVDTPGGVIPGHLANGEIHLCFQITSDQLDAWRNLLSQRDIEIESTVKWPRGGTSLYFRDPDRHLIELATPGIWPIY